MARTAASSRITTRTFHQLEKARRNRAAQEAPKQQARPTVAELNAAVNKSKELGNFVKELHKQFPPPPKDEEVIPHPEAVRLYLDKKCELVSRMGREAGYSAVQAIYTTKELEEVMPKKSKKVEQKEQQEKAKASKPASTREKKTEDTVIEFEVNKGGGKMETVTAECRKGSRIETMLRCLTTKKGLTKAEMLEKLVAAHPESKPKSLADYLAWAISAYVHKFPGYQVGRDDKGRYSTYFEERARVRILSPEAKAKVEERKAQKEAEKKQAEEEKEKARKNIENDPRRGGKAVKKKKTAAKKAEKKPKEEPAVEPDDQDAKTSDSGNDDGDIEGTGETAETTEE